MRTARLTSRIMSQSARPEYICTRVRPCTATAEAPACSQSRAKSTAFTLPPSQPLRNLTVTGASTAARTASIILPASSGSRIRAEPSPDFTTLPTGQPMLISRISAPDISSASCAASAMTSGSWPKICAAQGCSPSGTYSSARVFSSLYTSAFALTISVVVIAAPCSRQTPRNAKSDTPAIGASVSLPFSSTSPIFTMPCPAPPGSDPSR